ncbi:hypothetical protein [Segniliparus rugosus]|uniref:hypothetical protein n=1 Tax=Segniliparus rugosus TaxID=286804 RepID=UPI0001F03980|nr:hypothetical protein [Segniliparus rugosus]
MLLSARGASAAVRRDSGRGIPAPVPDRPDPGFGDRIHWAPPDGKTPRQKSAVLIAPKKSMKPVITPDGPERVFEPIEERIPTGQEPL